MSCANNLGILTNKPWSAAELEILIKYFPIEGWHMYYRFSGRTKEQVAVKARELNLVWQDTPVKHWTDDEITILKQYYPLEGTEVYKRLPGRTKSQCSAVAAKYKIKLLVHKFSETDDLIIKTYFETEGTIGCAKRLPGKTRTQIQYRARLLGCKAPKTLKQFNWTAETDILLKEYYPKYGSNAYKYIQGCSRSNCISRAKVLGLSTNTDNRVVWTQDKLDILKSNYSELGFDILKLLPDFTEQQIRSKAHELGLKREGRSGSKKVFCEETNITYKSASEAARQLKVSKSAIIAFLNGKYKADNLMGYHVRYIDEA